MPHSFKNDIYNILSLQHQRKIYILYSTYAKNIFTTYTFTQPLFPLNSQP